LLQTSFTALLKYLEIMIQQTLVLCEHTGLSVLKSCVQILLSQ